MKTMSYKISLTKDDIHADMPNDFNLGLMEACWRADVYKKRNPTAHFIVINESNGDVEYET